MNERYDSDQDAMEYAIDETEPLTVSELSELASLVETDTGPDTMTLEAWEDRYVMGEQERADYNQIWTDYAQKESRRRAA
jgi:hypothetical protein